MSDTNLAEEIYSQREIFDELKEQSKGINEKNAVAIHNGIKLLAVTLNTRIDVLGAKVDNLDISLNSKFDKVDATLNARIDVVDAKIDKLEAKIDNVEQTLSTAIEGLIDRFDDVKEHQNKWFTLFGFLFTAAAIITPVAVVIVQHYLK